MRHFTNRLFSGASVTTVFHELWHGLWNKAQASGTISRDEALGFVRSVDSVMGEKKMKRGQGQDQALRLLPADFDTLETKDQDTAISEALSHIAEMEVLRTRKRAVGDKSVKVGPAVISRNLLALSKLAPGATTKFRRLIDAARGVFGLYCRA